ncbi:putative UPF0503 protein, chloroplastic [Cocos nucifera]|uniref:Putative UPF0503 protein, chloroplastic n=1 Tax=Cocos nucifera TaxID=13894 RepID=A0A8K0NBL3_COCNU|nr:putative UPF0503 protein, chloroplastic [Cocos nucifera]
MSLEVQTTHHQLPQPPHRLPASSCLLHPDEHVTGFCASCLRERLAGLDTSSASGRKSTSSAFKSLFFKAPAASGGGGAQRTSSNATSSSFSRPELRRCKSFSCGRGDGLSGPRTSTFEPQRKSCDVRVRNTLWSLFHQDDKERDKHGVREPSAASAGEIEAECPNLGFPLPSSVAAPVLETREEEEEEKEERDNAEEIRVVDPVLVVGTSGEIEGGEREEEEEAELKPMKDHIDLDSAQTKKPSSKDLKEIAGSFWLAASVFSKKLQKWRRKQKFKKQGGDKTAAMPPEKPPKSSRRFRDTQSEIAVDVFGRRSCDTDPRFSLDAGRLSLDDPGFSWDEPRASWDGYLF